MGRQKTKRKEKAECESRVAPDNVRIDARRTSMLELASTHEDTGLF